jgi:RNA polymerase sigma factor (TIGR02999 family)
MKAATSRARGRRPAEASDRAVTAARGSASGRAPAIASAENDELFASLYETLRGLARIAMRPQSSAHTLQPTALVNEAFLKLMRRRKGWTSRAHFLSTAAVAMRCILVDHARTRSRIKRHARGHRISLDAAMLSFKRRQIDVLALDDALRRLAEHDPRAARVVELRCFGGLPVRDVSEILDVPVRTVERDWHWARIWLHAELS